MSRPRKLLKILLTAVGMMLLILDSKAALTGAANGVSICINTVIPSLFPFFVLSSLLTGSLQGSSIRVLQPLLRVCRLPKGAEGILIVGLIGGYPVGARCIAQQVNLGTIKKQDAHRMLGFCSNAGPSMIFGMSAALFEAPYIPWIILTIQWLSAILAGVILPGRSKNVLTPLYEAKISFSEAITGSIRSISCVCGWIVLFQVYLSICSRWFMWLLTPELQVIITGVFELSSGLISLFHINHEAIRLVLCSVMLSFGGLCVVMQTISVTDGIGLGSYIVGKLLQVTISGCLAMLCCFMLFPFSSLNWIWLPLMICIISSAGLSLYLRITEKSSSILHAVGV